MGRKHQKDEQLRRLFEAKQHGDIGFLIESLLGDPEHTTLPTRWLTKANATEAIPAFTRLLDYENPSARADGAVGLYRLGPPIEAKARLREMAERDPDLVARIWAVAALGKFRDSALVPFLVDLLQSNSWRMRNTAAHALGETGDGHAREALVEARRQARRSPVRWYLTRHAYRKAIDALRP